MAFCKHCGLRLVSTTNYCTCCKTITSPLSQEHDSHSALITMPPEHVVKRRKSFPMPDTLYTPGFPEYHPSQQGAKVIRKTHRLAILGMLLMSLLLLISVYSLFSVGFTALQWFLVPTPGSMAIELTPTHEQAKQASAALNITAAAPTPTRPQKERKPASTPTRHTHSAFQEARDLITHYYQGINARDYHAAYNLWRNNPLDYTTFAGGFVHTLHDTITFGPLTPQSDTIVHVPLTIQAKEVVFDNAITQLSIYDGYYLVQRQPDQSWRIIGAKFSRI
jgi:hypothetical protein